MTGDGAGPADEERVGSAIADEERVGSAIADEERVASAIADEERVVSAIAGEDDRMIEGALRPKRLSEVVGQNRVREQL